MVVFKYLHSAAKLFGYDGTYIPTDMLIPGPNTIEILDDQIDQMVVASLVQNEFNWGNNGSRLCN